MIGRSDRTIEGAGMRLTAARVLLFVASSTAQTTQQSLDARVVRGSNGAALARARVVVGVNGRAMATVLTDVQGRFSVNVPSAGVVTLTCSKAGFAPVAVTLRRVAARLDVLEEIAMEPGAAITGRVLEASGAPAVAARVTV